MDKKRIHYFTYLLNIYQKKLFYYELKLFLEKNAELDIDELFKSIYQYGLSCSSSGAYPDDFTLLGMEVISTA